ncbi:MAG: hypothetical protein WD069_15980, partial [Planctomycetales bacterium]
MKSVGDLVKDFRRKGAKPQRITRIADAACDQATQCRTPKGFHNKAQGQRRSRATLGIGTRMHEEPWKGSTTPGQKQWVFTRIRGSKVVYFQLCS